MHDEYISREAAIEEIDKWLDSVGTALVGKGLSYYGELIGCIEDARAADVAEVRHGEWEIVVGSNGKEYMVCTCCRVSQDLTGVFTYCPNCGAKMDGVVGSVAD